MDTNGVTTYIKNLKTNGITAYVRNLPLLLPFLLLLLSSTALSQQNVGIGTNNPDNSAILHLSSTDKGFLVPSMTSAQRNAITSPATGLLIFNTTSGLFEYNSGTPAFPVWTSLISMSLPSGNIWVGNASNQAAPVVLSGDATMTNGGVLSLSPNSVDGSNIDISGNAAGDLMYYNGTDWTRLAAGTNGQVLVTNGTAPLWSDANPGTVTSVDLSMPAQFAVTNNPVTRSGTLTVNWNSQATNLVFAAPDGSAGIPAFRLLSDNDIPDNITVSGYLPLAGGTLSGDILFSGNQTVDGVDISAHAANVDAHHSRLHAITSAQDHSAGNWKLFYSDGAGAITELDLGDNNYLLKSNGNTAAPSWLDPATLSSGTNWSLTGNDIDATAFIGTPAGNTESIILKTDGTERMRLQPDGKVAIGTNTAINLLDISGNASIGTAYAGIRTAPANGLIVEGKVGIGTYEIPDTVQLNVVGNTRIDGNLEVTGEIDPISVTYQPQATPPAAVTGKMYYDANTNTIKLYTGSSWESIGSGQTGGGEGVQLPTGCNDGDLLKFNGTDSTWVASSSLKVDGSKVGIGVSTPLTMLDVNGAITMRDTLITVNSNDFQVDVSNRSYIRLMSDTYMTPDNRRVILSDGSVIGQLLVICSGSTGNNLPVRIGSAGSNLKMNTTYKDINYNDNITLIWNGTQWLMLSWNDIP